MKKLLFLLLWTPLAFAETSAFPAAKKCGDSYWGSMREVDICIGGKPKKECPPKLKADEMLWALPSMEGKVVMVKTKGDKVTAYAPQPAFRIDGACYRIKNPSFFADEIIKTKCNKKPGQSETVKVDDTRVTADFLYRVSVDIEGLANEFEDYPPYDEISPANDRFTRYLAFNPEACKKTIEDLKASKNESLAPAIAGLEEQLKRWEKLKAASVAKGEPGGTKKTDGKN